jgi:hypothetical protein
MERHAIMDVSPLRQRYGAELPKAEAIHPFYNRVPAAQDSRGGVQGWSGRG